LAVHAGDQQVQLAGEPLPQRAALLRWLAYEWSHWRPSSELHEALSADPSLSQPLPLHPPSWNDQPTTLEELEISSFIEAWGIDAAAEHFGRPHEELEALTTDKTRTELLSRLIAEEQRALGITEDSLGEEFKRVSKLKGSHNEHSMRDQIVRAMKRIA